MVKVPIDVETHRHRDKRVHIPTVEVEPVMREEDKSPVRLNYRTSHQIRRQADLLLPQSVADVDGETEDRRGVVSVFNGAAPIVEIANSIEVEIDRVAHWIRGLIGRGVATGEVGIFVRSEREIPRAVQAGSKTGEQIYEIAASDREARDAIAIGTMHLAKGLEFRAVVVMACDDEVIPSQDRIEAVVDEADLEEVYDTERHLLYVACTRARDHLMVIGVEPISEFLGDLGVG